MCNQINYREHLKLICTNLLIKTFTVKPYKVKLTLITAILKLHVTQVQFKKTIERILILRAEILIIILQFYNLFQSNFWPRLPNHFALLYSPVAIYI